MMYRNENIPNPFQLILEQLADLERKIDELVKGQEAGRMVLPKEDLLTVQNATEFLKVSPSTLYQLTSRKEIPFMKRGKRLYFKKEDLLHWVEEGIYMPLTVSERQEKGLSYLRPKRRKLR